MQGYNWRKHDTYDQGSCMSRMVTRSQSCFNRIKNTSSDLDLFADPMKHEPPGHPHLMVTMKGEMGSVPNTMITRSTAQYLPISEDLCKKLEPYKKFKGEAAENEVVFMRPPPRPRSRGRGRRRK